MRKQMIKSEAFTMLILVIILELCACLVSAYPGALWPVDTAPYDSRPYPPNIELASDAAAENAFKAWLVNYILSCEQCDISQALADSTFRNSPHLGSLPELLKASRPLVPSKRGGNGWVWIPSQGYVQMSQTPEASDSDVFLVFLFTTMLMMMYVARLQHEGEIKQTAIRTRRDTRDKLRLEKLRELQKTIFLNPKRPPDHTYNINVTLSEMTPLEREITDTRPAQCSRAPVDPSTLLTVTSIIPFYNEALSMLLRTVHSVLARTPPSLLKEIILVNDHSPNEDLGEPLERYVKLLPSKVKLVKTKKREGLIRARLLGAEMATGDVLFFHDGHTECNVGWLEPLLEEIIKNPRTIIQPHVDQVEAWTIEYLGGAPIVPRGGFSWDLRYVWMEMPEHEKKRLNYQHDHVAHRTPTLVGCTIAIRKDYFFSIGGFDDDMEIWGGENIELAFRGWMCGGQVLTHPCSRVAHTFKPFSYQFDGDREKIVQKNQMRLAELWMDDWKKFFLASTWSWPTKHTHFTEKEIKSLEKRRILKKNLKCKSFQWYMENIIPEVSTPPLDAIFYGEIFNLRSEYCLYVAPDGYVAMTTFCFFHRLLPQNIFYIDQHQRLLYRNRCVRIDYESWLLKLGDCDMLLRPSERWEVDRHSEVEGMTKVTFDAMDTNNGNAVVTKTMCLTQVTNVNKIHYKEQMPQLLDCDKTTKFQKWRWTYKFDYSYDWEGPNAKKLTNS